MQIGALTAFLAYLMQIVMSVMMATFMFMMVPRAEVCAERIQEVLDTDSSVVPPAAPVRELRRHGQLELRGAEFRYPGAEEPVLRGIDLVARPGETTAVIGSTGSGKSTLLGLVPRLFDATERRGARRRRGRADARPGAAGADGRPGTAEAVSLLRHGRLQPALRQSGRDRRGAVARAGGRAGQGLRGAAGGRAGRADRAGRHATSPAVSGSGSRSPGRWCSGPEIYLFDDSFSALDYATDAALRAALARETAEATVVIVAQRVSTIRDADRIVVLDEGRVVGTGRHHELMAGNETYREIVLSQLTEAEAA